MDGELLEKLLGGKKNFVELHELQLKIEHREKGDMEKGFSSSSKILQLVEATIR